MGQLLGIRIFVLLCRAAIYDDMMAVESGEFVIIEYDIAEDMYLHEVSMR